MNKFDRIIGSLEGIASGDALGVLTVGYRQKQIYESYGKIPDRLVEPIPANTSRTKWNFGEVTDDTYQSFIVADVISKYGYIDRKYLVTKFLDLPLKYNKRDSSTGKLRDNPNHEINRFSTGSGAAMRITPIGLAIPINEKQTIITQCLNATQITHNSSSSISGACAIAFAISSIIEGLSKEEIIKNSIEGATLGSKYGEEDGYPSISSEIEKAINIGSREYRNLEDENWGFKTVEAVPTAIALLNENWNAELAIQEAIRFGGDSDTIGSIVGGLCGAYLPDSIPKNIIKSLSNLNEDIFNVGCNLHFTRNTFYGGGINEEKSTIVEI